MNAVVTGAGGFIGSHLAAELVKRGHQVTGLFLPGEETGDAEKKGIRIFQGDITRTETLQSLTDGADTIFHLATRTSDWGPAKAFEQVMINGTKNILDMCGQSVTRFVYFSSIAALGLNRHLDGLNEDAPRQVTGIPYCDTKIRAEDLVRSFCVDRGMFFTIIRPANVTGPGSVWVRDILDALSRGPVPLIGGGRSSGALVYVDNLVDATLLAAESPMAIGKTYHVRDDYDICWGDYIRFIGSHLNKKPKGNIPFAVARCLGHVLETILTPMGIRPPMTRLAAGVLGRSNDVDTTRIKTDLGWAGRVSLDEALERISQWITQVYIPTRNLKKG